MSELLETREVDALLAAMEAGGLDLANAVGAAPSPAGPGRRQEVQVDGSKRPKRLSKDQIRSLEALHEGFSRNLAASLSGCLRTIVEVSVSHIEQLTYGEFIRFLPNPSCCNLLRADGLTGQFCLQLSPLTVYSFIDRLLGGSNVELFIPQRPLTEIEQRLVQRVAEQCALHLSEAWSALAPLSFKLEGCESNPQRVQIVPPKETVVVVEFEVTMGPRAGTVALCIPFPAIEPIMGRLSQPNSLNCQLSRGGQDNLSSSPAHATVELRAVLARSTLTLGELLTLRPGDVLTTEESTSGPITLQIGGCSKLLGAMGLFRGRKAVRITRVLPQEPAGEPARLPTGRPQRAKPLQVASGRPVPAPLSPE